MQSGLWSSRAQDNVMHAIDPLTRLARVAVWRDTVPDTRLKLESLDLRAARCWLGL
jgi:hypothetical protein